MEYILSDTHFHHENIIKYCNRPFNNAEDMDSKLYYNWLNTIKSDDIVYFLGDLSLKNTKKILPTLSGNIIFIRGNHDRKNGYPNLPYLITNFDKYKCLLIHNPRDELVDKYINEVDFVIHGHTHNMFANHPNNFINVSVELTNYKPLPIPVLIEILIERKDCISYRY